MEREQALDAALSQIERQYGKGTVMKMGDQAQVAIPSISTGSLSLDVALGVGGLPRGRIVEIFGPESSGKTTLVYHVIAEAQRRGGICAFIDAEHAMDPAYARRIGVNIDDLLVSQPDNGEQALEIAELLIRSGAIDVVAVDSVAALTPKAEIEGEMGDSHVGLQARLMSQALRKLAGTLNRTGTVALFTNQLREKIGVMFGNPETTPGGRALKFYSSVRLDIRRIETLKEGVEAIGNRVRVKVVKNKVAPPFKQAEFDIIYGDGISWEGTVLDVGLEKKIVQKSGSYFSYGDERLGQGRQNATAFLREHPDVAEQILRALQTELGPDAVVSSRLLPVSDDASTPSKADAEAEEAEAAEQARGRGRSRLGSPRFAGRVPAVWPLELDGEAWRTVPDGVVVRCGLSAGVVLDRPLAAVSGPRVEARARPGDRGALAARPANVRAAAARAVAEPWRPPGRRRGRRRHAHRGRLRRRRAARPRPRGRARGARAGGTLRSKRASRVRGSRARRRSGGRRARPGNRPGRRTRRRPAAAESLGASSAPGVRLRDDRVRPREAWT